MLQVEHDEKWIKRLSALSKVYFTPTFIGAEQLDASQPAMYVGNHSMYGVLDSPMLIDYLYNESIRWLWSVLLIIAIFICHCGAVW